MSTDYIPAADGAFMQWGANFVSVADTNAGSLKLTTAELATLSALQEAFNAQFEQVAVDKATAKAGVANKDAAKKAFVVEVRKLVNKIQAVPEVGVGLKTQLGINPHDAIRNHDEPITPQGLKATLTESGAISLTWKRTGNKPNTVFQVEAKIGTDGNWFLVKSATATRTKVTTSQPGVVTFFRVSAARSSKVSLPSTVVVAYADGSGTAPISESVALKLAA